MEKVKEELLEILNRYPGQVLGGLIGLLVGLLAVLIIKFLGLWYAILICFCIVVGSYIGKERGRLER